jgi:hypothetical protein
MIMAYHGGYNYWKSKYTATLKHINNLYYIRPLSLVFTSGDEIRIDSMILFEEDSSRSPFTEHPGLVKTAYRNFMGSLLRTIKGL